MMNGKTTTANRITASLPRAAAGAILSSSLAALITALMMPDGEGSFLIGAVMALCAIVSALMELFSLPKAVRIIIPTVGAAAGAASLLIPRDDTGKNLLSVLINGGRTDARSVILPCVCVCAVLCSAVCMINRRYVLRCLTAGGAAIAMIVLIMMKMTILPAAAVLLLTYILLVVCQAFAPGRREDRRKGSGSWYVIVCLAAALIAVALPAPKTRIPWEKLIHFGQNEQMEKLGEALEIEALNDPETHKESGVGDDASSMGGWIDTNASQPLEVAFSDGAFVNRLNGNIYDCYTGKGWLCTVKLNDSGYGAFSDVDAVSGSDIGSVRIRKIGVLGETVFVPPYTLAIEPYDDTRAVNSGSRLVFSDEHFGVYTAYFAGSVPECELTDEERAAYLALPAELPERVAQFAHSAAAGKRSDSEKAQAIMDALAGYDYETKVESVPEDSDFVDYFLFDSKEGYCEYFASAMAVLARCEGIPSRLVIGFAIPQSKIQPIRITSANAHAWAELYIEGSGWVAYDPLEARAQAYAVQEDEPEDEDKNFSRENLAEMRNVLLFTYAAIAGLAVLFVLLSPFVSRMVSRVQFSSKHRGKAGFQVLRSCHGLLWTLSACGVRRDAAETVGEFAGRTASECDWMSAEVAKKTAQLLSRSERVLYSADPRRIKSVPGASRAVRRSYIRKFGLVRFIRGWWRAEV